MAQPPSNGYELSLSSAGKVFVRFNGNATYRIDSTTPYPTDGITWMHIAATYDGTNIRLYINGVQEGGTKPGVAIATNATNLGLGAEPATTVINLFQGTMDDARVYNRALSESEIQVLAGLVAPTCYALLSAIPARVQTRSPARPIPLAVRRVNMWLAKASA